MNSPEKVLGFSHSSAASTRGNRSGASVLRVAECFDSIQGEGRLTGTPSHFIRLSGCNLRCWFCDTPYASWHPEGPGRSLDEIVRRAVESDCQHVVLTGGEPLMFKGVEELVARLRSAGLHLTIETAGTLAPDVSADLMSISPKLSSSTPTVARAAGLSHLQTVSGSTIARWEQMHEQRRWQPQAIEKLIAASVDYQIKFVLDSSADTTEVLQAVTDLALPADHVWIMPQAVSTAELAKQARWLQPWCETHGFRFCDRMQIHWYGNRRGT
ncbi:7-carboxy-7-deazaguanine synthase QueE [Roseimaritima ulvae]|uniref:7-carboxy-7-deazaguanine synthase n=1 Tax=Roseimaritima ulvae TaxID=980254 RepID=A0A5B9QMN1_9BACT|nr:7-carboxy-7-deazaguanine synthase QueE [Roseimaritima ulvae]QEG40347.1 7-carboxy-7-deazaguanine synthase [Roseimaritima ulvae]